MKMKIWRTQMYGSTVGHARHPARRVPPADSSCFETVRQKDARIQRDGELSDSEDEGLGGRRHRQNHSRDSICSPAGSGKRKSKSPVASGGNSNGANGTNGTTPNGNGAGSKKPRKSSSVKSPIPGRAEEGGNEVEPEEALSPGPAGVVVSTGAIVPTEEINNDEKAEDGTPAVKAASASIEEPVAHPVAGPSEGDVDMDAANAQIETEKESGEIDQVGTEAKAPAAEEDGTIPPAPTVAEPVADAPIATEEAAPMEVDPSEDIPIDPNGPAASVGKLSTQIEAAAGEVDGAGQRSPSANSGAPTA